MFGMNGWNKEIPGGDSISRAAAIDAVAPFDDEYRIRDAIEDLPSAQPETHDKHTKMHACDLISRAEAIDVINESNSPIAEYLIGEIMALPSAQPKSYREGYQAGFKDAQLERKRGRWNCSDDMYESAVCSVCGWDTTEPWDHIRHWFNYCPNCGADMRGEQDG